MRQSIQFRYLAMGAAGSLVGACLGYYLLQILAQQGFYAIVLPGALTGLGCGYFSRHKSIPLGILCAIVGVIAGILSEWKIAPFIKDDGLGYFLLHLHHVRPFSLFLIVVGSLMAFWFGLGREQSK